MLLNAYSMFFRWEQFHESLMLARKGAQRDVRVEILLPGAQGYNSHYDKFTDGHEPGIDPGEMAARGITSGVQGRGELSVMFEQQQCSHTQLACRHACCC